jgi:hypothetical protein
MSSIYNSTGKSKKCVHNYSYGNILKSILLKTGKMTACQSHLPVTKCGEIAWDRNNGRCQLSFGFYTKHSICQSLSSKLLHTAVSNFRFGSSLLIRNPFSLNIRDDIKIYFFLIKVSYKVRFKELCAKIYQQELVILCNKMHFLTDF